MRIAVIGNPIAGGGQARSVIYELASILSLHGHEPDIDLTEAAGDAKSFASQLSPGSTDAIIVVGGDGTLNEVVNGLALPCPIPIAQLPYGTANMLATELRIPRTPSGLAGVVEQGAMRSFDVAEIEAVDAETGEAKRQRFLLVASVGFDARVTKAVKKIRRGRMGYLAYAHPLLKAAKGYVRPKLRVTIDGGEAQQAEMIVLSKTENYGGIFSLTPDARPDSGMLHAAQFQMAGLGTILWVGLLGLARMVRHSSVQQLTGKNFLIEADRAVAVQIDGDYFGTTPATVKLTGHTLNMVCAQ